MNDQKKAVKLLKEIKAEFELFVDEADKAVEKGNASAARRSRKSTSIMTKLFKDYRKATV